MPNHSQEYVPPDCFVPISPSELGGQRRSCARIIDESSVASVHEAIVLSPLRLTREADLVFQRCHAVHDAQKQQPQEAVGASQGKTTGCSPCAEFNVEEDAEM